MCAYNQHTTFMKTHRIVVVFHCVWKWCVSWQTAVGMILCSLWSLRPACSRHGTFILCGSAYKSSDGKQNNTRSPLRKVGADIAYGSCGRFWDQKLRKPNEARVRRPRAVYSAFHSQKHHKVASKKECLKISNSVDSTRIRMFVWIKSDF